MGPDKLLGKLESSWTIRELKEFLTFFRVPKEVIDRVDYEKPGLIELARQLESDEHITVQERLNGVKTIQRESGQRCLPERITSDRYKPTKPPPKLKPKPRPKPAKGSAKGPAKGLPQKPLSEFHQPRLPNETLEEEEREFMSRHCLYGNRDPRLELDDEVYAVNRPRPNLLLDAISSITDYKASLFDEEGRAPKRLAPLRMSWGESLGGKCYFSETGTEYINYGRGPTWGGWTANAKAIPPKPDLNPDQNITGKHVVANSCGIDSLIVTGMFLDIGQTIADRGSAPRSDWLKQLTPLQNEYIEAARTDWNDYTAVGSVKRKKQFYDAVLRSLNYEYAQFTPPAGVWTGPLGGNFHQFTFHMAIKKTCAKCGLTSIRGSRGGHRALSIDVDFEVVQKNPNFTLAHYLRYYFDHRAFQDKVMMSREFHCKVPPSKAQKIVVGGLPPRLVITPETRGKISVPIPEHTKGDISFRYEDETGHERSAIYRWIGGIYLANQHYRVYWDDSESEEGMVKVYDGQGPFTAGKSPHTWLFGTIIGGLDTSTLAEKVPTPWCEAPCLLFYERVDNPPDGEELEAISGVITKLKEATTIDMATEPGDRRRSGLQELLPIDGQIRNLAADPVTDHAQEIQQLQAKKASLKLAKEAQMQQLKKEKDAAAKQAKQEIEENKNARPPSQRSAGAPNALQPIPKRTRKESSTSLLQGVLGRAATSKPTSPSTTPPQTPPLTTTRRPSVFSKVALPLNPVAGTKRTGYPDGDAEASEAKKRKTLETTEERAVAAVVAAAEKSKEEHQEPSAQFNVEEFL
ncbi:hypothetical protein FGG08_003401 [Glutinoglossum americanum]|uniref:Uncharacterized protein n=1 Tax=Glutinoglossum americanum TaxID=1670608 RepID=A0A9P8IB45_9PEZI|nr:hypothetical protein FGG08_003401 [Glutinoglossum americanum]